MRIIDADAAAAKMCELCVVPENIREQIKCGRECFRVKALYDVPEIAVSGQLVRCYGCKHWDGADEICKISFDHTAADWFCAAAAKK